MKIVGFCNITICGQTIQIGTPAESQGTTLEDIKMDIAEAIDIINKANEQFDKAQKEILTEIQKLQASKPLTAEQEAIIRNLRNKAQSMDDIIPDEVPVEEPPVETETPKETGEGTGTIEENKES